MIATMTVRRVVYYPGDSTTCDASYETGVVVYESPWNSDDTCGYVEIEEAEPEEPCDPPEELPRPRLAYVERKRPRMTREQVWAKARSPPIKV